MQQSKLKLYTMNMKYVRDLHNVDDSVQSVSPQIHKSNRPFVGVVVVCDEHKYCIPLDRFNIGREEIKIEFLGFEAADSPDFKKSAISGIFIV